MRVWRLLLDDFLGAQLLHQSKPLKEAHHSEYESSYISYQELFDGILHLAESKLRMQDQND